MFDFMDSDGFIIGLEIVFLTFIAYDGFKFYKTRQRQYIINIVLAIGFALWVLVPFYTKYYDWTPDQREDFKVQCLNDHNASYCKCMDNMVYKAFEYGDYKKMNKEDKEYKIFLKDSFEECFEDSWF